MKSQAPGTSVQRPWLILRGGLTADLSSIYNAGVPKQHRTFSVFVKCGNVRFDTGILYINLQKQLQDLGCSYKPFGTHLTIAKLPSKANEEGVAFARRVAHHLGNRYHSVTMESWGAHSVLVKGPLCASIGAALLSGEAPWPITIPNPLHIELRPRLPEGRQYLEIDYWEVDEFHPRVKELPSQVESNDSAVASRAGYQGFDEDKRRNSA